MFTRFINEEDANRAIQAINDTQLDNCGEQILVKLAHFDIASSRSRWTTHYGSNTNNIMGNNMNLLTVPTLLDNTSNVNNMYLSANTEIFILHLIV